MSKSPSTEAHALRPDGPRRTRADRARSEPMAVVPLGDGQYDVVSRDECGDDEHADRVYTVDLAAGRCTCPDFRNRGTRCKHLRRVAIDVTDGRVPSPGEREAFCASCDGRFFVPEGEPDPVHCGVCTLEPGEAVLDRETDDLVFVVRTTDARADEVAVGGTGKTVAEYPTNDGYDAADVVVEVAYPLPGDLEPDEIEARHLRRYSFPRGRLTRPE